MSQKSRLVLRQKGWKYARYPLLNFKKRKMKSLFSQNLKLNNKNPKCVEKFENILLKIHDQLQERGFVTFRFSLIDLNWKKNISKQESTTILVDKESEVNCSTIYNLLAYVSYKLGYISSALKTIEDVLQSDPQNVTALLSLSHIYSQERLIVADNL